LIVSKEHKKIPSSLGHVAATTSPLFSKRQLALPLRSQKILEALENQSLATLGPLIEQEALELHAVARSGNPSADYLIADTLKFLEALGPPDRRDFFFTLDAGPNIHFLSVRPIQNELKKMAINLGLKDFEIWEDYAGHGPKLF
jgi:diphosphomevalonate decarboxylase